MILPRLDVLCLLYLLMMRITVGNCSLVEHTIYIFPNFVHLPLVIDEKPLMIFH